MQSTNPPSFFSKPSVATAIAVYIAVVGLVYNVVLRFLWNPEGMQQLVDELLHTFIPIAFVAYWFFFVAKKELTWTSFIPWLIYPLVYCIYILIRGVFSDFYPYPFMDVSKLGFGKVLVNSLIVTAVFLGFSLLFIGIGRKSNAK
jgi:Co/Zn/Cd efflux system component